MPERPDFQAPPSAPPRSREAPPTFNEQLVEQLRRTPWLFLSILAHAAFFGVAMLFASARPRGDGLPAVVATVDARPAEPFAQPEARPPEPAVELERDAEPGVPLRDVDSPALEGALGVEAREGARGDPAETSEFPFEGKGLNDVIGIGGGAGGKYGGRFGGKRDLRAGRGGQGTEESLRAALDWLSKHQSLDGRWDSDGFSQSCRGAPCDGPGEALHDIGVTGLALLAFLGDGNTHKSGDHRETVQKGLRWLLDQQDPESGLFGEKSGNAYLYGHAIATLALCEAYNLSNRSPVLRLPAQRAVNFIHRARSPYGAWRYQEPPTEESDTSVTGWMVFALKSAEDAGLDLDRAALEASLAWFDRVTDPATGRCGYMGKGQVSSRRIGSERRFPPDRTESLTAVALLCRFFLGQTPEKDPVMRQHADLLRKAPPVWDVNADRSLVDEYYWYYGTFAMFQMGGEDWRIWNGAMKKAILDHQRKDGDAKGSWDPIGAWGQDGGRVYMTAIGALCLEVYYRYVRILGAR